MKSPGGVPMKERTQHMNIAEFKQKAALPWHTLCLHIQKTEDTFKPSKKSCTAASSSGSPSMKHYGNYKTHFFPTVC